MTTKYYVFTESVDTEIVNQFLIKAQSELDAAQIILDKILSELNYQLKKYDSREDITPEKILDYIDDHRWPDGSSDAGYELWEFRKSNIYS